MLVVDAGPARLDAVREAWGEMMEPSTRFPLCESRHRLFVFSNQVLGLLDPRSPALVL